MSSNDEEDPFDVFGGDDGDDESDVDQEGEAVSVDRTKSSSNNNTTSKRAPENGFNLYHSGTEQAMIQFVKNELAKGVNAIQKENERLSTVIRLVDEFCFQRHWMMHIGPEKGRLLDEFLLDRVQQHRSNPKTRSQPFVILEIGTYCGYSCTRMVRVLKEQASLTDNDFRIITIDVDPLHVHIARQLHELAGIMSPTGAAGSTSNPNITYMELEPSIASNILGDRVRAALAQIAISETGGGSNTDGELTSNKLDTQSSSVVYPHFVFLDHDKDLYKQDLQHLEAAGIIRKGCAVAADNVYFFGLHDYRSYMQEQAKKGIVSTQLVKGLVEYVVEQKDDNDDEEWQDGIELSVYLKDPTRSE